MNYVEAASKFATARDKDRGKPLRNNTRLIQFGRWRNVRSTVPDYAIQLHDTCVVIIHADGMYTLHSGGWRTVTTKARINEFSPAIVYQKDFVWYLMYWDNGERESIEFYEGIRVDSEGRPIDLKAKSPSGRSA